MNLSIIAAMRLGSRRVGASGPAITGTPPELSQTITGNDLSVHVTWGSATAPDGETLTGGSPVREMNINGAGWVAYVPTTTLVDLETAQIRETWAVVGDTVPARTFNSALRTTVRELAVNTVAPTFSGGTGLGDVQTAERGTWTGAVGGAFVDQWQRDGVDIAGATGLTYTRVVADSLADIRFGTFYQNSGGDSVTAYSADSTSGDYTAVISALTAQVSAGSVDVYYTISRDEFVDVVLIQAPSLETAETITPAQIRAGNGYGNQPAVQFFDEQAFTSGAGTLNVALAGGLNSDDFYFAVVPTGSNVVSVVGPLTFATA